MALHVTFLLQMRIIPSLFIKFSLCLLDSLMHTCAWKRHYSNCVRQLCYRRLHVFHELITAICLSFILQCFLCNAVLHQLKYHYTEYNRRQVAIAELIYPS